MKPTQLVRIPGFLLLALAGLAVVGPDVGITSRLDGAFNAQGDSGIGDGDPNGAGFAIVGRSTR